MGQTDRKLQKAVKSLANLLKDEIPNGRLTRLIENGEVSESEVYKTLEKYGYEWKTNNWQQYRPQWLLDTIKQFENDLKGEGSHELLIWMPLDHREEQLGVFHDYLVNMERFIESEIEKRSLEWGATEEKPMVSEKPKTPYEQHLFDQWEAVEHDIWARSLQHSKDFRYILRNSFFVNLCAHLEADLRSQCPNPDKVGSPIIKNAVHQLITGSLANKIPEWNEVLCYVDIRNYIVHTSAVLDESHPSNRDRGDKVKRYCQTKANIKIKDNVIILEKGFCEDALETVERFLRKIKIVRIDLNKIKS